MTEAASAQMYLLKKCAEKPVNAMDLRKPMQMTRGVPLMLQMRCRQYQDEGLPVFVLHRGRGT